MQPTTSAQALQSILDFGKTRKNANDYLADANTQYGVNDLTARTSTLRNSINNTQSLLDAVPDSVSGRTAGSLVTDAARTRLVGMEQAPIAKNLSDQNSALGLASADLTDARNQAATFASNAYGGDTDKLSSLNTVYNGLLQQEDQKRQQEQAEREYQEWLQQFNESQRQFNEQMAQSRSSAASSLSGLGSLFTAPTSTSNTNDAKAKAQADVQSVLNNHNGDQLINYYNAVSKSASYGNPNDQLKLQLLRSLKPGLFASNGALDVNRIKALQKQGISI